jgi:2-phosphosulfolactate phosphatase
MRIKRCSTLAGAQEAEGVVVVLDVLRAFTCSAMMFSYGALELVLVATPEEAFEYRWRDSSYLLAGEVKGRKPDGFDLGNSPAEIIDKGENYFRGRRIVLRTSSGTQGAIAVGQSAREVIVAAYTTAAAVARYIRQKQGDDAVVTLLAMGVEANRKSVEDERCGDYIEHLLTNRPYDHVAAIWGCLQDPSITRSLRGEREHLGKEDVILSLQRDLFDFAMVGTPVSGSVIVRPFWLPVA